MTNENPSGNPVAVELRLPSSAEFGPPIDPHRVNTMPFADALYWIASEGGTLAIGANDYEPWQRAFNNLRDAIVCGRVQLIGLSAEQDVSEQIPGCKVAGLPAVLPGQSPTLKQAIGEEAHIACSIPLLPEKDWQILPDQIEGRHRRTRPLWSHLIVTGADVAREWPFGTAALTRPKSRGQQEAIQNTVLALWPTGVPEGLPAKRRDAEIAKYMKERGFFAPSPRSIRRALSNK